MVEPICKKCQFQHFKNENCFVEGPENTRQKELPGEFHEPPLMTQDGQYLPAVQVARDMDCAECGLPISMTASRFTDMTGDVHIHKHAACVSLEEHTRHFP